MPAKGHTPRIAQGGPKVSPQDLVFEFFVNMQIHQRNTLYIVHTVGAKLDLHPDLTMHFSSLSLSLSPSSILLEEEERRGLTWLLNRG